MIDAKRVTLRNVKQTTIPVRITAEMVPQAFMLVSHVTQRGDLISDYVLIHVDGSPFANNVRTLYKYLCLKDKYAL